VHVGCSDNLQSLQETERQTGGRQLADSSSSRLSLMQDELFAAGNCASKAGDRLRIDRQCWQMMKTSVRVGSLDGQSQQMGEKYMDSEHVL